MEEQDYKQSKYSTGVNINLRIDQLWKDTHTHSRLGNYYTWNLDLDCIWSELARDLKEKATDKIKAFETIEKEFLKFDEDLIKLGGIMDNSPSGFKKVTKEEKENRGKQYSILRKKQIFLARLENNLGKGTTYEDDDDDDM